MTTTNGFARPASMDLSQDPAWNDSDRALGQLFIMGFDGTVVTPHLRALIETHSLGNILLTAKNLTSAGDTARLVYELQKIAFDAGHPVPLSIAVDQENGGVNSLYDESCIQQYPSAMGMAATNSTQLAFDVAAATARELSACGINWVFGPCLDTLSTARNQPLGSRAFCDDPHQVAQFGAAYMKGYQSAGVLTMGKHFPSYGHLDYLGSTSDVPAIRDSLDQLSSSALIPFGHAVNEGIDSIMVGGCAMSSPGLDVMHACLSPQVVDSLLRRDLNYDGVVVSECLEMEALSTSIGIVNGVIMAYNAGCDLALLCRNPNVQQEAIEGLKLGLQTGAISQDRVRQALGRVLRMKSSSALCDWQVALNAPGKSTLMTMQPSHEQLSIRAYKESITVVRDCDNHLPLSHVLKADDELLLLTPLVKPLAASAAARALSHTLDRQAHGASPESFLSASSNSADKPAIIMGSEGVFTELGSSLSQYRQGKVLHTSYTTNGLRPVHENLIRRAKAVVLVTADASRNLYQNAYTKHVGMLCKLSTPPKALVVVAVSSPYDFALDSSSAGTYICTYDFTETALRTLSGVLYGQHPATGRLPGSINKSQKLSSSRQQWLVEAYDEARDAKALNMLILATSAKQQQKLMASELVGASFAAFSLEQAGVRGEYYVVRNSSTRALHGFCATYYFEATATGVIAALFVDPARHGQSIGASLHNAAVRGLLQQRGVRTLQVGSRLPNVYLGIPSDRGTESSSLRAWFSELGWTTVLSRRVQSMMNRNLLNWTPPEGMTRSLQNAQATVEFDLIYGSEYSAYMLEHTRAAPAQPGACEVYMMALADPNHCGIIRAKRHRDGGCLGSVILYNSESRLARHVPAMKSFPDSIGGMSTPIISAAPGEEPGVVLQSLVLLGLRQIKQQGVNNCLLDNIDGGSTMGSSLQAMGFEALHQFEEISCDAAAWISTGS